MTATLILTLTLDDASQAFFDQARTRWFPARINFIHAHVTLFHKLPGAQMVSIREHLAAVCEEQSPADVSVTGVLSLGRGVAYGLHAPEIDTLRSRLAARWRDDLTAQDHQRWRPHVTVQNKVAPGEARSLMRELSLEFTPFRATATGIAVWWYCGGPWKFETAVPFAG